MPVVAAPRPDRLTVSTAPLPGVRRRAAETPESLGAGVALAEAQSSRATAQFAEGVTQQILTERAKAIKKARDTADDTALLDVQNQYARWETTRLYNGPTAALNIMGKQAQALPEALTTEFTTVMSDLEAQLNTPEQRARFAVFRAGAGQELDLKVQRHVSEQAKAYQVGEVKASIANHSDAAATNWADSTKVGDSMGAALAEMDKFFPDLGLGPEAIASAKDDFRSKTWKAVIGNALAANDTALATHYVDIIKAANKDATGALQPAGQRQMNGNDLADIAKALEIGTKREQVQTAYDAMSVMPELLDAKGQLDLGKAKAYAAKHYGGEIEDDLRQRVEHEVAVQRQQTQLTQEATFNRAALDVRAGKRVPPAVLADLTEGERQVLDTLTRKLALGEDPVDDYNVVAELENELNGSPEQQKVFRERKLYEFHLLLSKSKLDRFTQVQAQMRGGQHALADALAVDTRNQNAMVTQALQGMGFDPTPPDPTSKTYNAVNAANTNAFRRQVRERIDDLQRKSVQAGVPKAVTDEQVQAIVDELAQPTQGAFAGHWYLPGSKKPARYRFQEGQSDVGGGEVAHISQVPPEVAASIRIASTTTNPGNQPLSDDDVVEMWNDILANRPVKLVRPQNPFVKQTIGGGR